MAASGVLSGSVIALLGVTAAAGALMRAAGLVVKASTSLEMMLIAAQVMVWAAAGVDSAAVSSLTADSGTSASIHAATECSTAALSNLITARMKRQWRRSGNSGIGVHNRR